MSKKISKWNKKCTYTILDKLKLIKALCGQSVTFCDKLWYWIVVCGLAWPYVALYDLLWSCMCSLVVLYGLFMVLDGLSMDLYGVLWSFIAKCKFYWTCIVFFRGHRSKLICSCCVLYYTFSELFIVETACLWYCNFLTRNFLQGQTSYVNHGWCYHVILPWMLFSEE